MAPIRSGLIDDQQVVVTQEDLPQPQPQPRQITDPAATPPSSYDEVVASGISQDWTRPPEPSSSIGITEVDQGASIPTYGYTSSAREYFDNQLPAGSSGITAQDQGPSIATYGYTPAVEPAIGQSAADFFGGPPEGSAGATLFGSDVSQYGFGGAGTYKPPTTYVTTEDWLNQLYGGLGDEPQLGAMPIPGANTPFADSGWFGTDEEQQREDAAWWQQYNAAQAAGDNGRVEQLNAQRRAVDDAWTTYQTEWSAWDGQRRQWLDYQQRRAEVDQQVAAASTPDPRGEGGYFRQPIRVDPVGDMADTGGPWQSSVLIPNELLRGYMDALGTPETGKTPDGEIMLRSDIKRQADYQDALSRQPQRQLDAQAVEAEQLLQDPASSPERRQQAEAELNLYGRARDLQSLEHDPYAPVQGVSGTFYNGRREDENFYGPAPDGGPVGKALAAVAGIPIPLGPGGASVGAYATDRRQLAARQGSAGLAAIQAEQVLNDPAATAEQRKRAQETVDLATALAQAKPGGSLTLGDAALGALYIASLSGRYGWQAVSYLGTVVKVGASADAGGQRLRDEGLVGMMRNDYDRQSGLVRFVGETAADPLNYIPIGGWAVAGVRTAERGYEMTRLARVAWGAFSDAELRVVGAELTTGEIRRTNRAAQEIYRLIGGTTELDQAVATRIATKGLLERRVGGALAEDWVQREVGDNLAEMAGRLGATPEELAQVEARLGRQRTAVQSVLSSEPATPIQGPVARAQERVSAETADVPETAVSSEAAAERVTEGGGSPTAQAAIDGARRRGAIEIDPRYTADAYMERNPGLVNREIGPSRPGPTDPAVAFPTEGHIRLMETQARVARVPAAGSWNPIRELEALPVEERTLARASRIIENAPPTRGQEALANDLRQQKLLDAADHQRIRQAKVTAREAWEINANALATKATRGEAEQLGLMDRVRDLRGRGHAVELDPTTPGFGPRLIAAVVNDEKRRLIGRQVVELLPRVAAEGGGRLRGLPGYLRGAGKVAAGETTGELISPFRFREMVLANADQIMTDMTSMSDALFNLVLDEGRMYVSIASGEASETVAGRSFWRNLRQLRAGIEQRMYPADELEAFHRLLAGEYDEGAAAATAVRRKAEAETRLAGMPAREREARLAENARKIEENKALGRQLAEINRAYRTGDRSRDLLLARETTRRAIENNTAYIRMVDPEYRPDPARLRPKERVAERDMELQRAVPEVTPSSDPELGFNPETLANDSTNDALETVIAPPAGAEATPVTFAPPKTAVAAEPAGPTPRSVRGQLAARRGEKPTARMTVDELISAIRSDQLGIVHPAIRTSLRRVVPQVDLVSGAWARIDWASKDIADTISAALNDIYDYSRFETVAPDAAGKYSAVMSSHITRTADMTENWLRSRLGPALESGDPDGYLQRMVLELIDPATTADRVGAIDGFFTTPDGSEVLRMLRTHGDVIRENWFAMTPYLSAAKLGPDVLAIPLHGRLGTAEMRQLEQFVFGNTLPRNANRVTAEYYRTLRSVMRERWAEVRAAHWDDAGGGWRLHDDATEARLKGFDDVLARAQDEHDKATSALRVLQSQADRIRGAGGKVPQDLTRQLDLARADQRDARDFLEKVKKHQRQAQDAAKGAEGIHIEDLDGALFPDEIDAPYDLGLKARQMASLVADAEAKRIGFDPQAMDIALKTMAVVKGNYASLWMTINPIYTFNNLVGNQSSQLLGALHSGMHGGLLPRIDPDWAAAINEVGSGIVSQAYLETNLTHLTENVAGSATRERFVPQVIHGTLPRPSFRGGAGEVVKGTVQAPFWLLGKTLNSPSEVLRVLGLKDTVGKGVARRLSGDAAADGFKIGTGGYESLMAEINNAAERRYKTAIFSTEAMHQYRKGIRKALGTLGLEDNADLASAVGLNQMQLALTKHGIAGDLADEVMRQTRKAIDLANLRGYDTAATVLRDYRMRNSLDGFLDHIVPVHYWTTKNLMFAGKVAANRPGVALTAMRGLDAWRESNRDLPYSLRMGMLPIPGSLVPFAADDRPFYFRVTNMMNPAIFAIPQVVEQLSTGRGSLADRARATTLGNAAALWGGFGYRVGPQYDAVDRLFGLVTNLAGVDDTRWAQLARLGMQTLISPSGFRGELIPNSSQLFSRVPGLRTGTDVRWVGNIGLESLNTRVYGYAYTRYEVSQFMRTIQDWQREGRIDQEEGDRLRLLLAQSQKKRDMSAVQADPALQQIIGQVLTDNANRALSAKLGWSGREYDPTWQYTTAANRTYQDILANGGDPRQAQAAARRNWEQYEPFFARWLDTQVSSGAIDRDAATVALEDARNGNLGNELFQRAAADAQRLIDGHGQGIADNVLGMADGLMQAVDTYEQMVRESGRDAANAWARENPDIFGYWLANDDPDKVITNILRNQAYRETRAAYEEERKHRTRENGYRSPYYERLDAIDTAFAVELERTDDPGDRAVLERSMREMKSRVYAEAEDAGHPLLPSHLLPRKGPLSYEMTPEQRRFFEANATPAEMEDLLRHDTAKAQRGWLIDTTARVLGMDRQSDEFKDDRGHFDIRLWDAALAERAAKAPAVYRELVSNISRTSDRTGLNDGRNSPVVGGIVVEALEPITAADFTHHLRDAYPNSAALDRELAVWRDMEPGAAKDAKRASIESVYGKDILERYYGNRSYEATVGEDGKTVYTAAENAIYGEATRDFGGIATLYQQFTPRQKAEFKAQYPDAFEEATGTNEDGSTYTYQRLAPAKMTSGQVNQVLKDYGINPDGTPFGRTPGDLDVPEKPSLDTVSDADARLVKDKTDEYFNILTPEEELASRRYSALRDNPLYGEAEALAKANPSRRGNPNWYKARDLASAAGNGALVKVINDRFELVEQMGPVWDKQQEWFAGQDETTRQLLVAENPSIFGRYADAVAGGGTESAQNAPGAAGSGGTSDSSPSAPARVSGSQTARSSGSGKASSGASRISSGSGGAGASRSSAGAEPVISSEDPLSLTPYLRALDPFLTGGDDDGRGDLVDAISTALNARFALFSFLPKDTQGLLIAALGPWLRRMLGTDPDYGAWERLLRTLRPQQPEPPPAAPAIPLTEDTQAVA